MDNRRKKILETLIMFYSPVFYYIHFFFINARVIMLLLSLWLIFNIPIDYWIYCGYVALLLSLCSVDGHNYFSTNVCTVKHATRLVRQDLILFDVTFRPSYNLYMPFQCTIIVNIIHIL